MVFTNGQIGDRVKTRLDRHASDFQRRAQLRAQDFSVKSVISVFGLAVFRTPKFTEIHRNTPKEAAGAGGREIGCAGRSHLVHVWISTGKHATTRWHACHRQAQLAIAALASLVGASGGTLNSYVKGFIFGIAVSRLCGGIYQ